LGFCKLFRRKAQNSILPSFAWKFGWQDLFSESIVSDGYAKPEGAIEMTDQNFVFLCAKVVICEIGFGKAVFAWHLDFAESYFADDYLGTEKYEVLICHFDGANPSKEFAEYANTRPEKNSEKLVTIPSRMFWGQYHSSQCRTNESRETHLVILS
jgi:hypothetical protein